MVPLFSPSVLSSAGAAAGTGATAGDKENRSPRVQYTVAPTPTPRRRAAPRQQHSPHHQHHSSSSSSPAERSTYSQETLFFSPLAHRQPPSSTPRKEELEVNDGRSDDDDVDDGSSLTLETALEMSLRGGGGYGTGSGAYGTTTVVRDALELSPFSGITHSTVFRPPSSLDRRATPTTTKNATTTTPAPRRPHSGHRYDTTGMAMVPSSYTPPLSTVAATSYKSLPRLDMVSPEFLEQCTDANTLRRIMNVLLPVENNNDDPTHRHSQFPQLLQLAQARYAAVTERPRDDQGETVTVTAKPVAASRPIRPTPLLVNTSPLAPNINDSLTMSTDSGGGGGGTMTGNSSVKLLRDALERTNNNRRYTPRSMHLPFNTTPTQQQLHLLRQSSALGDAATTSPSSPYVQQQQQLERTTQELQDLQELLRTSTLQHDKSTQELQQALAKLHQQLDAQRQVANESQAQELVCRTRANELAQQLELQQRAYQEATDTWTHKHHQLSEFLKASQKQCDTVTHERTAILRQMQQTLRTDGSADPVVEVRRSKGNFTPACSKSVQCPPLTDLLLHCQLFMSQVDKLTKEQRDQIVADFCSQLTDAKHRIDELAANIRETDKERRKFLKAYQRAKDRCAATQECLVAAERDNQLLAAEMDGLTRHLQEAQTVARRAAEQEALWEQRQRDSSAVIRRLKEQVRTTETMVPIGVYKSALKASDEHAAKAQEYRHKVNDLTVQVSTLSARIAERQVAEKQSKVAAPVASRPPPPPPPPPPPAAATIPGRVLQPKEATKTTVRPAPGTHSKSFQTPHHHPKPPPLSVTPLGTKRTPPSRNSQHTIARTPAATVNGTAIAKENQVTTENRPTPPAPGSSGRKAVSFAKDAAPEPKSATKIADTPPEHRSASKIAQLRAAGGRKGLEEQLRRIRSPRNQPQVQV